jgi:hypothetical protein
MNLNIKNIKKAKLKNYKKKKEHTCSADTPLTESEAQENGPDRIRAPKEQT